MNHRQIKRNLVEVLHLLGYSYDQIGVMFINFGYENLYRMKILRKARLLLHTKYEVDEAGRLISNFLKSSI